MSFSDFDLETPDAHRHLLPMAQLAADAFTDGKYVEAFCNNYIGGSHYDWDASRLITAGDQVIHHWGVWGYQMRVESLQLKVAGIGAVVTHPEYRKQGLMHRAAHSSFAAMREAGYDLSILRGRHYVKMGYARAWNYVTYRLKLEDVAGFELVQPYQSLTLAQVRAMDALYNQTHSDFTGTAIRPTFYNRHPEDLGVYAWFDNPGLLTGYVRAFPTEENPKVLQCLEAAGDPQQGLAVLYDLCKQGEYESLACFTLPHHHPMLQLLRKGACVVENRYFDISGWRIRLINIHSAIQKLIPLLEQRLSNSSFASWQGELTLDSGMQKVTLQIERGKVNLSENGSSPNTLRGGADIARFLIGSDESDEIIQQANMACSGSAAALARVLFPNLNPMMSHWDEY